MVNSWRTLRVPASSANLGPGFDALGLALGIYLECRFRRAPALDIRATGRDASLISTAADNLIWETALQVAADAGRALDPIELEIRNNIPVGKGLGSSAAALIAGVVIAEETLSLGWQPAQILDAAARIEGHPDNVAPCVFGSLVASAIDSEGHVRAVGLQMHPRYAVAVVVPDFVVSTAAARRVLPETYSRDDAVFNVQRSALLIAAVVTGTSIAFPAALEDRLHQPYRFALVPGLEEITKLRAPGLLGCALSGAGPSILVFYERGHEAVCEAVQRVFTKEGHASEILWTEIPARGYELL
jgi:homoserine kinase